MPFSFKLDNDVRVLPSAGIGEKIGICSFGIAAIQHV